MQYKNRIILWIILGVFAWGVIHAMGAYLNFRATNPWRVARAVAVLLSVEAFLAFWLVLLLLRRTRLRTVAGPAKRPSAEGEGR